MTTLRELFKKTKKATKETTDRVLDTDLEKVGKATKEVTLGFFTHMLIYGSGIFAILCIFFVVKWSYLDPNWCKNNFLRHIHGNAEPFDKFSNIDKKKFVEKWYDSDCSSTIVYSSNELEINKSLYNYSFFNKKFKKYKKFNYDLD